MKKTAFLLYALCAFIPSHATMPDYLRQYAAKDGEQLAIFDAMDRAEKDNPDSMDKINYDAYPDGRRTISRMITSYRSSSAPDYLHHVFDSLLYVSNPQRFSIKKDDMIIFQFGINDSNNRLIMDFSDNDPSTMTNVSAINGRGHTCAQSWTINTDRPSFEGNFSAITNRFDQISKNRYSLTQNISFPIQTAPGGVLRLRDNVTSPENKVTGRRVIDTRSVAGEWIKVYDLFMEHFGSNENISISYYRNRRMITLIDYNTKTIYAACFKAENAATTANGTLIILIAEYSGSHPYLPANWATAK